MVCTCTLERSVIQKQRLRLVESISASCMLELTQAVSCNRGGERRSGDIGVKSVEPSRTKESLCSTIMVVSGCQLLPQQYFPAHF